jgi:outer membrane immunogenic protein
MQAIRHILTVAAVAGAIWFGASEANADEWDTGFISPTDLQGQPDWTGFYVGGKLGGAWSDIGWTRDALLVGEPASVSASFSPSGVAGGLLLGANLQNGSWVFGLEYSFSGVDLSQTLSDGAGNSASTSLDWLMTVEGRVGYAFDHYLLFAKGGWVGSNAVIDLNLGGQSVTTEKFVDGWTIGGGIEAQVWRRAVIGLEYSYTDLKLSQAASCPFCIGGITAFAEPPDLTGDAIVNTVMLRASYLFFPED